MPLALLARAAGRLGLGPGRSLPSDPTDDTLRALDAAVPVIMLALRAFSFMAECSALRSFRASIVVVVSESDPDPGGLFSSLMVGKSLVGRGIPSPDGDGEKLPVLVTSSDRKGGVRWVSGELDDKFKLINGGFGIGDPSGRRECLAPFDRNPAWNLLGLAAPKLLTSGTSRLGLDSSLAGCCDSSSSR
jgi:hypothetical protein